STTKAPEAIDTDLCLVISRTCATIRADTIIVAEIRPKSLDLEDDLGFDEVRRVLQVARDGYTSPDSLYLGTIPNLGTTRFCARLDSLHTIVVDGFRRTKLETNRIACLSEDACRHVAEKLFNTFARTGFDDFGWLCDADLSLLLSSAETELKAKEHDLSQARQKLETAVANNRAEKELKGR